MATAPKRSTAPFIRAKVTSKGQVTIPVEVRKCLGIQPGDNLIFEAEEGGFRVVRDAQESVFEKFRGIGNLGIGSGKGAIARYMREIRGYDEQDDLLARH